MAEMYLTDKMIQQHLENSSVSSIHERDGMDDGVLHADMDDGYLTSLLFDCRSPSFPLCTSLSGVLNDSHCNIRIPDEISLEANGVSATYEGDLQNIDNSQEHLFGTPHALGRDSHGTHTSTTHSAISKHLDVEELEMLLEAYFVQIDGTLNKLSTVCNSNIGSEFFHF